MALTYDDIFILDLFSISQAKKGSTVFHILQGKRTASILYRAVDYSLESLFGFFPQLNRSLFHQRLEELVSRGDLVFLSENDEYLRTQKGEDSVSTYFLDHYRPAYLNWLTNGRAVQEFQMKIYFLTQIFSEIRHQNSRYIPLEKNFDIQQWAKQWLRQQETDQQALAVEFGMEWKTVLSSLERENAAILVNLMSGHQIVGSTKNQLSHQLNIAELEITVRQYDSISYLIKHISNIEKQVPLFASIVHETIENNQNGLSKSAKETVLFLKRGFSIQKICQIRRLKKSTISEHIIEFVILFPEIEIQQFIPKEIYPFLQRFLSDFPESSFQEAADRIPELEFLWYRLMQIERRRKNEGND